MLRKKENFTTITPIPSYIPRQLAVDILHSHSEVITINPLVIGHKPIKAPQNATTDEYYSTWYEITERLQFVPGIGKFGSKQISFNGCFHDMPWGLQTHIYAPAGVDMRNNWRVCGNQPGEPIETRELGVGAPAEGLYLREDVEIKCNSMMVSFVKAEMKKASKVMVERMVKKAEMLDQGQLQGMFENGRLTTLNPADRTAVNQAVIDHNNRQSYAAPSPKSPIGSVYGRPVSAYQSGQPQLAPPAPIVMELPGDMYHSQPPTSPSFQQGQPYGPNSVGRQPSAASNNRLSSYSNNADYPSPQPHDHYASELPATSAPPVRATSVSAKQAEAQNANAGAGMQQPPHGEHPAFRNSHPAPDFGDVAMGSQGGGRTRVIMP